MQKLGLNGTKEKVFEEISSNLLKLGFEVVKQDQSRPWGGFFVIDESQAKQFADHFFPSVEFKSIQLSNKLSPKILVVEGGRRLSWQYHHRRAEIWKLVAGTAGVVTSDTDEETALRTLLKDEVVRLNQGERHRLVGLAGWGVIAEIWQHTDPEKPSDEDDIVRVQDDFGRR